MAGSRAGTRARSGGCGDSGAGPPAPPGRPTPVRQDVLPSLANRTDPLRGAD
jgi:hypothetical protein